MLRQINAFDPTILKKGMGVVVTERRTSGSPSVVHFNALILSSKSLVLEIAYIKGDGLETKEIRPREVEDGSINIRLMVPYNPPQEGGVPDASTSTSTATDSTSGNSNTSNG